MPGSGLLLVHGHRVAAKDRLQPAGPGLRRAAGEEDRGEEGGGEAHGQAAGVAGAGFFALSIDAPRKPALLAMMLFILSPLGYNRTSRRTVVAAHRL